MSLIFFLFLQPMRRIYTVFSLSLAFVALLCSCQEVEIDSLYGVSSARNSLVLRIGGYELLPFSNESFPTRATDLCSLCDKLCVAVYRSDELDTLATQSVSDSCFGTVSLRLMPGKCRVVVIAHSSERNPDMTNVKKVIFGRQNMSDIFFWTREIDVRQDTLCDVSMLRAVAKVEVNTTDAIPADVGSMFFIISKGSFNFNPLVGQGVYSGNYTETVAVPDSIVGTPGSFMFYTFPTADSVKASFVLEAMQKGDKGIYCKREFSDVPLVRNAVVRLTGEFFKK